MNYSCQAVIYMIIEEHLQIIVECVYRGFHNLNILLTK